MYITRDVYRLSNFFCAVIVKQEYRYSLMDIFYLCAFQYSLDAKVCKQTVLSYVYIIIFLNIPFLTSWIWHIVLTSHTRYLHFILISFVCTQYLRK